MNLYNVIARITFRTLEADAQNAVDNIPVIVVKCREIHTAMFGEILTG